MPEPPQSRAAGHPFAVAVGAIVAVAAVVVVVVRAGSTGPAPRDPGVTNVDIVSDPVGASVIRADDGGVLGLAPLTLTLPKSETDLPVIVRHEGYQDRLVKVPLFSMSGRIDVELIKIGADAAAQTRPAHPDR
jgi:hypothetical protein